MMNDCRKLAQRLSVLRQVFTQVLEHRARSNLLIHPTLEHRVRGFPQVKLWIKLSSQALDIKKRLVQ